MDFGDLIIDPAQVLALYLGSSQHDGRRDGRRVVRVYFQRREESLIANDVEPEQLTDLRDYLLERATAYKFARQQRGG